MNKRHRIIILIVSLIIGYLISVIFSIKYKDESSTVEDQIVIRMLGTPTLSYVYETEETLTQFMGKYEDEDYVVISNEDGCIVIPKANILEIEEKRE